MLTTRRRRKEPSAARGKKRKPGDARARNRSMVDLLAEMCGTQAVVEARGCIHLPWWAIRELDLKRGDRLDFVVVAGGLGLWPARPRPFNRAALLPDGSVRLPSVVLDHAAALGQMVLEALGGGGYRLCRAGMAAATGEAMAASGQAVFPAPISTAGRLLLPAPVIAGLGAACGDTLVFGGRDDGSFEIQALGLLVERTAAALGDLVAGVSGAGEEQERQQAEARERAVGGDPLAGAWRLM
jgi:bifunctional DNA-binding transcriptional regulator/antitoxin component of YhaV-PrlF toxin-antitoxin module